MGLSFVGPANAWDDGESVAEPRALLAPGGLWLGLRGAFTRSDGQRQRVAGLLELGIGLERLGLDFDELEAARSRRLLATNDAPPSEETLGALPRALPSVQVPRVERPPSRTCADAASCGADVPPGARLSPALARSTVAAALRVRDTANQLRRLEGMAARSRSAASLPEVRLGAGTSRDESLKLSPTQADPARFTRDGGRDLWFEARLIWRLDGAVFSKDEIAVERLKAEQREDRARTTREVLDALMDWQQARFALASERLLPEERDTAWLRELGALARLDILSDGWFSAQLPRANPAP
jgi:hypothetical protein